MTDTLMSVEEFEKLLPSQLVELALHDLKALEKNPLYEIDMDLYHCFDDGKCHVCFAGCILANTFNLAVDYEISDADYQFKVLFSQNVAAKLYALDAFRDGYIHSFAAKFPPSIATVIRTAYEEGKFPDFTTEYNKSPEEFKEWVRDMVAVFKQIGI